MEPVENYFITDGKDATTTYKPGVPRLRCWRRWPSRHIAATRTTHRLSMRYIDANSAGSLGSPSQLVCRFPCVMFQGEIDLAGLRRLLAHGNISFELGGC